MSQPNLADEFDQPALEEEQPAVQPPQARREVPTQKQKTSIYTVMLIIAFVCIVIACILLFWELSLWGDYPWWRTNEGRPNIVSQLTLPEGASWLG